ncbi:TPA: hypothetical protein OB695_000192 [Escherichia coli]|nr:hypothetical protein [Escherichia coli]
MKYITEWDGNGLPPVGLTVMCVSTGYLHASFNRFIGNDVFIVAHDHIDGVDVAVFRMQIDNSGEEYAYHSLTANFFRQIRSEEDKKRDAAISAIDAACLLVRDASKTASAIYDAIAAGDIPGVKIE